MKVSVHGEMLNQVNQFKYLGSTMTSDAKSTVDIKCKTHSRKRKLYWQSLRCHSSQDTKS